MHARTLLTAYAYIHSASYIINSLIHSMIHSFPYIYTCTFNTLHSLFADSLILPTALWSELSANKTVVAGSLRLLISNTIEDYMITVTRVIGQRNTATTTILIDQMFISRSYDHRFNSWSNTLT
ncbi:hypothetical protein MS3_00000586 [Schistosoma haematobium]|uniref:Uncharacterized protein n=1 Tax=Schistosoma haematobium TaxID=6185 RepID=A0A922IL02_SCHHA|nr:hypothetical protein MS3_00000586 [Schistosoma haematobium]KAH9581278.1 hypothetical protein MS3_00000586 [Schistosoma haematobium]